MIKAATLSRSNAAAVDTGDQSNRPVATRPVLVAGSGRSGTTWISEILAASVGCVSVFEPLHARRVPEVPATDALTPACPFPGPYLRSDDTAPEWETFFDHVFTGRVENCWTRQDWRAKPTRFGTSLLPDAITLRWARRRYRADAAKASRRVIKIIRGNLLLGWLHHRFSPATVLIVRHPCAVVASRLRHRWSDSLDGIWSQPKLIADHLAPFHDAIASAGDSLQRMTILWCVENLTALTTIGGNPDVSIRCYESFVDTPQQEFSRLQNRLGLRASERAGRAIDRWTSNPSQKTLLHRRNWDGGLSTRDIDRVLDTCQRCGMGIYDRGWAPADLTRFVVPDPPHGVTGR